MRRSKIPSAIVFLLPNFLGLAFFVIFPVVLSLWMAFTNWSLKPAVRFEVVGLRNFKDLLAVRAIDVAHWPLLAGYVLSTLAIGAGLISAMWGNFTNWRGIKLSGVLFTAVAAGMLLAVFRGSSGAGTFLAAVFLGISGIMAVRREDATWRMGLGIMPGLLLAAGVVALTLQDTAMWKAYELRDARFWSYFYNTLFLMSGIPVGIAGALVLALLLNDPLPAGPRAGRMIVAGVLLVVGAGISCIIYVIGDHVARAGGAGAAVSGTAGVLLKNGACLFMVLWLVAALGIAFNVVAFRTLFYLPTFTAGVALMILWKALYNPENGPIDAVIGTVFGHLQPLAEHAGFGGVARWLGENASPRWLGDKDLAKPALIVMGLWIAMGGTNMLLYLAALSNVPRDLLDAAEVDGAGRWARFRHVTWPQLAPTTFFITIMSVIGGLQGGFEQARVMTLGGPETSTTTLSYYIYNKAFQDLDLGYAAAIAWVLFALIFIATALNWKFGRGLEVDL